ncbi:Biogenesis of lysosome-related organelles complex 1 subunit, partial [Quillaja saponaria]
TENVFTLNFHYLAAAPSPSSVTEGSHADPGGLEASLLQLLHDHHHASLTLRQHTDKAKNDAIKIAARVSNLLVEAVNGGVQESFINEKRIEVEIRALASTITRFMKQTDQWLVATHSLNTAVKEIGDFENWMKAMEYDCKSITAAIHNIHQE